MKKEQIIKALDNLKGNSPIVNTRRLLLLNMLAEIELKEKLNDDNP